MKSFPWRTLLLVSVAINLLLLGAIAGHRLSTRKEMIAKAEQAVGRAPNIRPLLEALPPERAAEVRSQLARAFIANRDKRAAAREARRKLITVGMAEPFDAQAMRAAYAEVRARDEAVSAAFHEVTVDAFVQMTPQERQAALKRLAQAGQRAREPGAWRKGRMFGNGAGVAPPENKGDQAPATPPAPPPQ